MARGWWQNEHNKGGEQDDKKEMHLDFQFEWIRAQTQKRVIQLAGMALASDFVSERLQTSHVRVLTSARPSYFVLGICFCRLQARWQCNCPGSYTGKMQIICMSYH